MPVASYLCQGARFYLVDQVIFFAQPWAFDAWPSCVNADIHTCIHTCIDGVVVGMFVR